MQIFVGMEFLHCCSTGKRVGGGDMGIVTDVIVGPKTKASLLRMVAGEQDPHGSGQSLGENPSVGVGQDRFFHL